jgi:signal transduction histidine kinase
METEDETVRLAAALARRDALLRQLGHELRNRVGALTVALDVLDASVRDRPMADEARDVIARQARQLTVALQDILLRIDGELRR